MDFLLNLYNNFLQISKENPIIAGAVSLWGLSVVTYLCRNVPQKIWKVISAQVTTKLTLNNAGFDDNKLQFECFNRWFLKNKLAKFSRNLHLENMNYPFKGLVVGPGNGLHFFVFKGRLFWFVKYDIASTGTTMQKYGITIFTFGRKHDVFLDLIEEFSYKPDANAITILEYRGKNSGWCQMCEIPFRDIDTVIIKKEVKENVINAIKRFQQREEWYKQRGLPYKQCHLFHGIPGTGKTSFIKALASHFHVDIYQINISGIANSEFFSALSTVPKGSFVVIEDFDTVGAVKNRKHAKTTKDETASETKVGESIPAENIMDAASDLMDMIGLNLTTVLNGLDGVVPLNGTVIFLSTNHIEDIDPAVLRKGRVDYITEIEILTDTEVRDYIALMFPMACIPTDIVFKNILGCDLQAIFFDHSDTVEDFIQAIPHWKKRHKLC